MEVCVCKDKNKENGVKSIILINLEEGEFIKDEEEQWHFKSISGHQWEINKVPQKFREGDKVTEADMNVINFTMGLRKSSQMNCARKGFG